VEELKDLCHLGFNCPLKKPLNLSPLRDLETLKCTWSPKIVGLETCDRLRLLNITRYPHRDLEQLAHFPNLEFVWITSRKLESFAGIESLEKLQQVDLWTCPEVVSITHIASADSLTKLVLGGCKKIGAIPRFKQPLRLVSLELNNCGKLANLRFLEDMPELKGLRILGDTTITDGDLSVIESLPKLTILTIPPKRHYSPHPKSLFSMVRQRRNETT